MDKLAPYGKAIVGFLAPGAASLVASVLPGSAGGEAITRGEAITALCACIVTAAAVYAVPNRSDVDHTEDDAGL